MRAERILSNLREELIDKPKRERREAAKRLAKRRLERKAYLAGKIQLNGEFLA